MQGTPFPDHIAYLPSARYMGNKRRLLPWIHGVLSTLEFESAADVFCGSVSVSYLLKAMGKKVFSADFLNFAFVAFTSDFRVSRFDFRLCLGEEN